MKTAVIGILPAAIVWLGSVALGQYSIDWRTLDGGGGTGTNGQYSLSATIGPPDAGGPMTTGPYSLVGGFWVLPGLVQTPGFATVWWTPPTPGFTLQSTDSLLPTNWVNAPSGAANPAPVPATLPARFYRLLTP